MSFNLSSLCLVLALTSIGAAKLECDRDIEIIVGKMLKTYYFNSDAEARRERDFTLDACSFEMNRMLGRVETKVVFDQQTVCEFDFQYVRSKNIEAENVTILEQDYSAMVNPHCYDVQDHSGLIPEIVEEKLNFDETKNSSEDHHSAEHLSEPKELFIENPIDEKQLMEDFGSVPLVKFTKESLDEIDRTVMSLVSAEVFEFDGKLAAEIEALEGGKSEENSDEAQEEVTKSETLEEKHENQGLKEGEELPQNLKVDEFFGEEEEEEEKLDDIIEAVFQSLGEDVADKVDSIETKRKIVGEKTLVGGLNNCDKKQEAEFIGSIVKHLNLAASDRIDTTVITCKTQVVAGLNVELTIGTKENNCHAHLFYALYASAPEIDLRSYNCVSKFGQQELIPEFTLQRCTEFNKIRALNSFRAEYEGSPLARAYEENIISCSQEKVDGLKITLYLSFNEKKCAYRFYTATNGNTQTVGTLDCSL